MRRVVWVGGLAGGEAGEFGGHGLAEHDRPGGAGQRDAGGIGGWAVVPVDRRTVAGRHVGGIDQILDGDRDAVQRPARRLGIALPRGGERRRGVEEVPSADHLLAGGDTVETGGHQRLGGQPAGGDFLRGGAGGEQLRFRHWASGGQQNDAPW